MVATTMKENCDGCVVQCLVENDEEAGSIASVAHQLEDPSVIILIGKENDELAESARDVAALEWVKKNTPSLAGDRVARQELSERRLEAEMAFRSEWNRIFEPGSKGCTCYWRCMGTTSFQIEAIAKRPVRYGHYIDGPASGCYDFK